MFHICQYNKITCTHSEFNVRDPVVMFEITNPMLAISLPLLGGRNGGILYASIQPGLIQGGPADILSMLVTLNCQRMRINA